MFEQFKDLNLTVMELSVEVIEENLFIRVLLGNYLLLLGKVILVWKCIGC